MIGNLPTIEPLINAALPAVYEECLSYGEIVARMKAKINEIINAINAGAIGEIEAVIDQYLTEEKIEELIEGGFGTFVTNAIATNNGNYYTKAQIDGMTVSEERVTQIAEETASDIAETKIGTALTGYSTTAQMTSAISASAESTFESAIEYTNGQLEDVPTETEMQTYVAGELTDFETETVTPAIENAVSDRMTQQQTQQLITAGFTPINTRLNNDIEPRIEALEESGNGGSVNHSFMLGGDWSTVYNNPHNLFPSIYPSKCECNMTNLHEYTSAMKTNPFGTEALVTITGFVVPHGIDDASIVPANNTGICAFDGEIDCGFEDEIIIIGHIYNTTSGESTYIPLSLVPKDGKTVLVYKYINTTATPSFTGASNKRLYLNASFRATFISEE